MALLVLDVALRRQLAAQTVRCPQIGSVASLHTLDKIDKREIVGYGWNGTACYFYDRADYPMPAIRFREPTIIHFIIHNLHQKEKRDWKKMSIDEKKALYRVSFRQRFAEIQTSAGEFKKHFGVGLLFTAMAIWVAVVYNEMPITFDEAHKKAQSKHMIDLEMNPVTGLASKWNYQNNSWNSSKCLQL
uniref:Cytochrome c oxidase subunit 4 n=1 Tax=Glossina austeni TaxID=7395 RepID=A0A1A9V1W7_GLOAU